MTITFTLPPARLPREGRKHWTRARKERYDACLAAQVARVPGTGAVLVRLVRVARRPCDDDNLRTALKHQRDGVLDATWRCCAEHRGLCGPLHDSTGPDQTRIEYGQERGKAGTRVEVEAV